MYELIDPPETFAPTKVWRDFLAGLEASPQTPEVKQSISLAKSVLAQHRKWEKDSPALMNQLNRSAKTS